MCMGTSEAAKVDPRVWEELFKFRVKPSVSRAAVSLVCQIGRNLASHPVVTDDRKGINRRPIRKTERTRCLKPADFFLNK